MYSPESVPQRPGSLYARCAGVSEATDADAGTLLRYECVSTAIPSDRQRWLTGQHATSQSCSSCLVDARCVKLRKSARWAKCDIFTVPCAGF